jgi:hypothetical protein
MVYCTFSVKFTKIRTPWKTNLSFSFSLFAGLVPVSDLGHMVSIGTLLAFVLVCLVYWSCVKKCLMHLELLRHLSSHM